METAEKPNTHAKAEQGNTEDSSHPDLQPWMPDSSAPFANVAVPDDRF